MFAESIRTLSCVLTVLLVTLPRRVEKSTLLERCAACDRNSVTPNDASECEVTVNRPALFL